MIKEARLSKTYLFIRKKRFRKKWHIYKMALSVIIDKTTAIYVGLLVVYLFSSLFIFGDYFHGLNNVFTTVEVTMKKGFWLILTVLPIRYVFRSFQDPGVVYSTTEHQLGMLPYKRERIWFFTAVEKMIWKLVTYAFLGAVITLLTPISNGLVLSYIILLFVYDIIMLIPQWKLYQQRFFTKTGWLCVIIVINGISALLASPIVGAILLLVIIALNIRLFQGLFIGVKWEKVTETSDFKIWNMPLIAQASKVKFKRNKKYGIFANSKRHKRPFRYTTKAIHQRLWNIYLSKNIVLIMQLIGALLLMLLIFPWINSWLFQIGIALAIYAYSSVASTFFTDRFQVDILDVLPWDLQAYRKTFFKWAIYGGVVLLLPVIVYLMVHWTLWSPLQFIFYMVVFLYVYDSKMKKALGLIAKESVFTTWSDFLSAIFLLGIIISDFYPILSVGTLFILFLLWRQDRE